MKLNVIAGRGNNSDDFNKYPIFPWILNDYESEKLDLKNPEIYRNFTRQRLNLRSNKYLNYKTVLYYLFRVEPYTKISLKHNKMNFLKSIPLFWDEIKNNKLQFKEIIPEFYYLPEMFLNLNNITIIENNKTKSMQNVKLPPWSNGSADEFVRIHRRALESDYISEHLNEWIDYIFGCKQKNNLKSDQGLVVNNLKLFDKPHPKRNKKIIKNTNFFHNSKNYQLLYTMLKNVNLQFSFLKILNCASIPSLYLNKSRSQKKKTLLFRYNILLFDYNRNLILKSYTCQFININFEKITNKDNKMGKVDEDEDDDSTNKEKNNENQSNVYEIDQIIKTPLNNSPLLIYKNESSTRSRIGISLDTDIVYPHNQFVLSKKKKIFVSCGYWDNSFKLNDIRNCKSIQEIYYHKDIVTCLKLKNDYLVAGSRDTTISIWKFPPLDFGNNDKLKLKKNLKEYYLGIRMRSQQ